MFKCCYGANVSWKGETNPENYKRVGWEGQDLEY